MRPRRILVTADAVGGVWTYALELARGLTASGSEVLLAVLGPEPGPDQRAAAAAIPGLDLIVTGLELEWQDRAGPLGPQAQETLLALERTFRPDIVHINGYREAAAGFRAPVVLVAHSCVATWWAACRHEALPASWEAYARGVCAGLAAADAVVAPTRAFLDELCAVWGISRGRLDALAAPTPALPRLTAREGVEDVEDAAHPPSPAESGGGSGWGRPEPRRPASRTCVIPNGLDLEPPAVPQCRPIILAAGRLWDEAKNVAALARIAPDLPWPVLLAGEPPREGLDGPVHHLGRLSQPDLQARMTEAAIFAAPARYEPFGLAVLEAARAGCALVLGSTPSLIELWDGAARFVPPDDPDTLRTTLLDLIADDPARERLQTAAAERSRRYGRQPMLDGYRALYAELLHERIPARGCAA